jgi:hypothetical protein
MLPGSDKARRPATIAWRSGMAALIAAALVLPAAGAVRTAAAADRIILRNLQIISDKKVVSFDEDGVRLEGGRSLGWDEIERGTVAPADQEAFNRLLADLGDHLFRIRRRLEDGDYKSAPPADDEGKPAADYKSLLTECEAVYPRFVGRQGRTAYMVFQGLMWARLEAGRREDALEPYLDCHEHLRAVGAAKAVLPGKRRLNVDADTGITPELLPVWFDARAAKAAMPRVLAAVSRMKKPLPDAARVYYGTLALAAGQQREALPVLEGIQEGQPAMAPWREIAMAQREVLSGKPGQSVGRLEKSLATVGTSARPAALYWLGMAGVASDLPAAKRDGVLRLLHLPALYGKTHPDLAAAGLYQSIGTLAELKDTAGAGSLRRELLGRYGQTPHAAKARAELSSRKDGEVTP